MERIGSSFAIKGDRAARAGMPEPESSRDSSQYVSRATSGHQADDSDQLGSIEEIIRGSSDGGASAGDSASVPPAVTATLTVIEPENLPTLPVTGGLSASSALPPTLGDAREEEIEEVGCDDVAAHVADAEGMTNGHSPLGGPSSQLGTRGVAKDEMC